MEINNLKVGTTQHDELSSLSEMFSSFCSEDHDSLNPLQEIFGTKSTLRVVISEPKDVTEKPQEDKDTGDQCNKSNRPLKRTRSMDYRMIMEKRRRKLIKDKVEVLEKMTPNCAKSDIATKLESIAEYMKTLKHQQEVMFMAYTEAAGYMQPYYGAQQAPMMSPWGYYAPPGTPMMPQQNVPYIPQFHQVHDVTAPPNQTGPIYKF
ncbi:hypothetical protein AALP_AA2G103700 [Arabis alpina]|uniref:BHLH domain-containing protein n=1 Tax=Arabis alpina TaxID=50452 RepID=A0A087HGI6_ARAAL|nr:hypothetical protein AALP_AA2G103700 [Arabis alpina]